MVTKQQIVEFINSQPPSRPVNMDQSDSHNECGCVMVHYGKEVLGIREAFGCGYNSIGGDKNNSLETDIDTIIPIAMWDDIKTYGDIQRVLSVK